MKKQEIIFACDKDQIFDFNEDKGFFTLEQLEIFTINNPDIFVIIRNYAMIKQGEVKYMQ